MKTINKRISIFAAMMLIVSGIQFHVSGQQAENGDKTESPYFFVKSDDASLDQMPLKSTSAEVNIAGVIADVKVRQVYKNEGRKTLEAIYIFPASTRAAVHAMRMKIGKRIIEALVKEKNQARQEYEQAKAEGKSASLLEQQRPNVFQMNVANILPGDVIEVELDYTELLIPENAVYEFDYPTVVGPRYNNSPPMVLAMKDDKGPHNPWLPQTHNDQWVSNPYTHEGEKPMYTFDINCSLDAGMPLSDLRCKSHDVDIKYNGPDKAEVSLKNPASDGGNKDFILQYRLCGSQIASGVLTYEGKDENFFLAMIQPPQRVKASQIPPREYVFIVDVSGSMFGYPLEISKKLMKDLISKLRPEDKFDIVLFAGGSQVFSPSSVAATRENIANGIAFINSQQGGGGTELLPALKTALTLGSSEGMSRSFIIATDGYVTVEKEAFNLIRNNMGNANFFAFGIGTAVNRYLIEGIAHTGLGLPFIISKPDEAEMTAGTFREYISSPVLTDISVKYSGIDVYDVEPKTIPDVFSARPILVFGKYRNKTENASITVNGFGGEEKFHDNMTLASTGKDATTLALRYLWARERIRNIDDFSSAGNNADPESSKEVTSLGLKYNLLTKYTSFIAVDSEVRNKDGHSTTINQPLPLPEGVSNNAVGGNTAYYSPASMGYNAAPRLTKSLQKSVVPVVNYDSAPEMEVISSPSRNKDEKLSLTIVEEMPSFPGGEAAMQEFLRNNIVFPAQAKLAGISGTVFVKFTVEADGRITNIKVMRGIGGGCDEEAVRVIKKMPKFKPGKQAGKACRVEFTIPIKFIGS